MSICRARDTSKMWVCCAKRRRRYPMRYSSKPKAGREADRDVLMNARRRIAVPAALHCVPSPPRSRRPVSGCRRRPAYSRARVFSVDLVMDASDLAAQRNGIVGEIVVDYDPALLSFEALTMGSGVSQLQSTQVDPTQGTVSFGFGNAPREGTVASLNFEAIGASGSNAVLDLSDADDFFGGFYTTNPTNQVFFPDFIDATVGISAIPLPGSAWLIGIAVATLAPRLRRARTVHHGQ